jgi:hypothetical protein
MLLELSIVPLVLLVLMQIRQERYSAFYAVLVHTVMSREQQRQQLALRVILAHSCTITVILHAMHAMLVHLPIPQGRHGVLLVHRGCTPILLNFHIAINVM